MFYKKWLFLTTVQDSLGSPKCFLCGVTVKPFYNLYFFECRVHMPSDFTDWPGSNPVDQIS